MEYTKKMREGTGKRGYTISPVRFYISRFLRLLNSSVLFKLSIAGLYVPVTVSGRARKPAQDNVHQPAVSDDPFQQPLFSTITGDDLEICPFARRQGT